MGKGLVKLHNKLRELSLISKNFIPDQERIVLHAFPTELRGYSDASLCLAVCKKINPPEFAIDQAIFMQFLGEDICPKVLGICEDCYFMEYLFPAELHVDSLVVQENFLQQVWDRGIIHGDPTLDNVLMTKQGFIRITDPIPPHWLRKPNIQPVDHGKMLQSLLGWEVVLRGAPYIQYSWPKFMTTDYETASRAIFWVMISIQRIIGRDLNDRVTQWATIIGKELEALCELSSWQQDKAVDISKLDTKSLSHSLK